MNHKSRNSNSMIYAREIFENMYNQYHILGANGVMDDIYRKFMALPLEEKED